MKTILRKEHSIYSIELTVNKSCKEIYEFQSFEEACAFLYNDVKNIVSALSETNSAYYNACLFFITENTKQLLIRKNLCKVYF